MLETKGKLPHDSHPNVKKREKNKQKNKTNSPTALFLFCHFLHLTLDFGLPG